MIDVLKVMKGKYGLEEVVKLGKDKFVMRFDNLESSQKFLREYINNYLTPEVGTAGFVLREVEGIKEGNKFCLIIPKHMYPAINEYMWKYADQVGFQDLLFEGVRVK